MNMGKFDPERIKSANEQERFEDALLRSAPDYQIALNRNTQERLSRYFSLVQRWNKRLHLVAPCSPEEFAERHVLESLTVTNHIPSGGTVADIGSGAGLPLIPSLIIRQDLRGYMIEASGKKAVFLREALKATETAIQALVLVNRFEKVKAPPVGFVTCRALERFQEMLPLLVNWSPRPCTLLLFGGTKLKSRLDELALNYERKLLPHSMQRSLFIVALR
jgi:16S rRNA (guanine527-N7)-methyltransferase